MKVNRSKITSIIQIILSVILGIYAWYNMSSIYWRKDLELPINEIAWLFISISICVLSFGCLIHIFRDRFAKNRLREFLRSVVTTSIGLPLVNFLTGLAFTSLGGETSIYFIFNDGLQNLAADSTLLLILGFMIGAIIFALAFLLPFIFNRSTLP